MRGSVKLHVFASISVREDRKHKLQNQGSWFAPSREWIDSSRQCPFWISRKFRSLWLDDPFTNTGTTRTVRTVSPAIQHDGKILPPINYKLYKQYASQVDDICQCFKLCISVAMKLLMHAKMFLMHEPIYTPLKDAFVFQGFCTTIILFGMQMWQRNVWRI